LQKIVKGGNDVKYLQLTLCAVLALVIFNAAGCGPANPEADAVSSSNKTNIQRLVNLYILHQQQNRYAGPADLEAFKEFIKKTDPRRLEMMGIDVNAVDQLFVSERDGEQFTIKYNITAGPHGCTDPAIFEASGKDGKRQVGFLNMVQKEVDAADYDTLMAGGTLADVKVTSSGKSGDNRGGQ
jgi:hypothetical protein